MPDLRSHLAATQYDVVIGENVDAYWGKKLAKISRRFPNPWERILKGLQEEYKVFDVSKILGGAKYNLLVTSPNGQYSYYKIEIKFYPNMSASSGGCRAGVFVSLGEYVVITCAGLHEHYDRYSRCGSDKERMLEILKNEYNSLFKLLMGW